MQKRVLGRTGMEVSVIGLGGIPIIRASKSEGVRVVKRALDLGINYFDTARGYGQGKSEDVMGAGLRGRREECFIASQTGAPDAEGAMKHVEETLEAMKVDVVDLYKCHGVITPENLEKVMAPGGAMDGLKKAQEQGKVRFVGMSGHRPEVLADACRTGAVDAVLVTFNFVNDAAIEKLLPVAKEHNVGVTVMKGLGGSLFQHPDLCLRWLLEHDIAEISVGMWKVSEVEQNVMVGRDPQPLNEEERQWLADERARWNKSYCRLCYTCEPCPKGVDVRGLMILELNYRRLGRQIMMVERKVGEQIAALNHCHACQTCAVKCDYDLPIQKLMKEVQRTYGPLVEEYVRDHGHTTQAS